MQATLVSGTPQTINYTRPEADVDAGNIEVTGTIAGVDICGGEADELGALAIGGEAEFDVVKITETAYAVGATVYWNATANPQSGTAGTGAATANVEDYVLGICTLAATEDATTVRVKLQQYAIPSS
jgi:predicted RecA/RadA family phage recombinase